MPEVKWLDEQEQAAWRTFLEVCARLPDVLDAELRSEAGLGLDDYEVLVHLSEAPDRRLRMNELAESVVHSRSRLTYRVDRLSDAGLVCRLACTEDARGTFAVLTDEGFALLESIAPVHVRGVREHLIDRLEPDELRAVATGLGRAAEFLRAGG